MNGHELENQDQRRHGEENTKTQSLTSAENKEIAELRDQLAHCVMYLSVCECGCEKGYGGSMAFICVRCRLLERIGKRT